MVVTKGGTALRALLARKVKRRRRMTQAQLARELGVSQPTVSDWMRMHNRPESHLRKAIERVLNISADDWMTEDERAIADGDARAVDCGTSRA